MTTQCQPADASGGGEGLDLTLALRIAIEGALRDRWTMWAEKSDDSPGPLARALVEDDRVAAVLAATPPAPTPASEDELRAEDAEQ